MEAIASGCYCLSHRWDGADELLPDEALFFTEQEMIQRILAYCSISEDEKKEKTNKLYQEVRDRFNVDKTKVQIRQVVEEVGGHWQPYR